MNFRRLYLLLSTAGKMLLLVSWGRYWEVKRENCQQGLGKRVCVIVSVGNGKWSCVNS